MYDKPRRCLDCDGGIFTGDGRCSHCHGSGVNLNLASDIPKCLSCDGSGVCKTCGGTGMAPDEQGPGSSIQTLFDQ
jgi:hypothetical protein